MKNKKGIAITNTFQKLLDEYDRKPNKIWTDKGSEFYNRSMKLWLESYAVEMYSTHNEVKSVAAERIIRTLKNKIYIDMISVSKNVYIDKLDDIVNKYNNTYQETIKMEPVYVKSSIFIDFNKGNNKEGPKFKVDDHLRTSKF